MSTVRRPIVVSALSLVAVTAGVGLAALVSPALAEADVQSATAAVSAPANVSSAFDPLAATAVGEMDILPVTVQPDDDLLASSGAGGAIALSDSGGLALIVSTGVLATAAVGAGVAVGMRRREAD